MGGVHTSRHTICHARRGLADYLRSLRAAISGRRVIGVDLFGDDKCGWHFSILVCPWGSYASDVVDGLFNY